MYLRYKEIVLCFYVLMLTLYQQHDSESCLVSPPGDAAPAVDSLQAPLLPVDGALHAAPPGVWRSGPTNHREVREAPEISTLPDNVTRVVVRCYCGLRLRQATNQALAPPLPPHSLLIGRLDFLCFESPATKQQPCSHQSPDLLRSEKVCSEDGAAELSCFPPSGKLL